MVLAGPGVQLSGAKLPLMEKSSQLSRRGCWVPRPYAMLRWSAKVEKQVVALVKAAVA